MPELIVWQRALAVLAAVQNCRRDRPTLRSPIHTRVRADEVLRHFRGDVLSLGIEGAVLRLNGPPFARLDISIAYQRHTAHVCLWLEDPRDHPDIRSADRKTDQTVVRQIATIERRRSALKKQFARNE